jgi:CRP-like cAMP-binding protein
VARSETNALVRRIQEVPLFAGLDAKHLRMIAEVLRERPYPAGTTILEEGSTDRRFYLITSGVADVTVRGELLNTLQEGDYFGEIALIDGAPRAATVTAKTDIETLTLADFSFRPILKENPEVVHRLLLNVCALLRDTEAKLYA